MRRASHVDIPKKPGDKGYDEWLKASQNMQSAQTTERREMLERSEGSYSWRSDTGSPHKESED